MPPIPRHRDAPPYGIVIDCGSSGTRLRIFEWRYAGHGTQLRELSTLSEDAAMALRVQPGISAFAQNHSRAIDQLMELTRKAAPWIPSSLHGEPRCPLVGGRFDSARPGSTPLT